MCVLRRLEQLLAVRLDQVFAVFDDFFTFGFDQLVCLFFKFELEVGWVLSLMHEAWFGLLRS